MDGQTNGQLPNLYKDDIVLIILKNLTKINLTTKHISKSSKIAQWGKSPPPPLIKKH